MKIIIPFIVLVLFLGCAQPPVEEMERAREAVFMAENDANAVLYAGSTLTRAREALRNMQLEADSKRYDTAKTYAIEAIAAADKAIADGRAGAQRTAAESASLVSGLRSEIEETSRNVNGARYSLMDLDYETLDRSIVNAYSGSDQADNDHAAGRYQDAMDRARTVRTDLANINQIIANAVVIGKK